MSDGTTAPEVARELDKLKRAVFSVRDELGRQRVEMDLMRRDLAANYAMLRMLVERSVIDGAEKVG